MSRTADLGVLVRFLAGLAGAGLLGFALFGASLFEPNGIPFECVTVGALVAGIVSLVLASRPGQAVSLVAAFALVHLGYALTRGWQPAFLELAGRIALGAGCLAGAVLFEAIGREGFRVGKFAVLGVLVGGAYAAASPLSCLAGAAGDCVGLLLRRAVVGFVVGNGVGLAVEIVDLFPGPLGRSGAEDLAEPPGPEVARGERGRP